MAAPALRARHPCGHGRRDRRRPLADGVNPKIAVCYTGLLPTLAPPQLPAAWAMVLLVLLHAALTLAWLGGCVLLLTRSGHLLRSPRSRRFLGRTTGAVLIGFGLVAVSV